MSDNIPLNKFIPNVIKTYAENTESNIDIAIHAPKTHPGMQKHGQFIVVDKDKGETVSKFRMYE